MPKNRGGQAASYGVFDKNKTKALDNQALQSAQKIKVAKALVAKGEEILKALEVMRDDNLAEAPALRASGHAWLEDLKVFHEEKTIKKGSRCAYWHCSWGEGRRAKNMYLGSYKKNPK